MHKSTLVWGREFIYPIGDMHLLMVISAKNPTALWRHTQLSLGPDNIYFFMNWITFIFFMHARIKPIQFKCGLKIKCDLKSKFGFILVFSWTQSRDFVSGLWPLSKSIDQWENYVLFIFMQIRSWLVCPIWLKVQLNQF